MIMLFAKDLAYYDGTEDFVKRFKEVIGGGQKFDTNAEYEGEKVGITHQNLIYIKDVKVKSNIYESIEHILQERVNKKYFTKQEFSDTMENFKSMSLTDSQGLKNLDTRRIEEIMLGN